MLGHNHSEISFLPYSGYPGVVSPVPSDHWKLDHLSFLGMFRNQKSEVPTTQFLVTNRGSYIHTQSNSVTLHSPSVYM